MSAEHVDCFQVCQQKILSASSMMVVPSHRNHAVYIGEKYCQKIHPLSRNNNVTYIQTDDRRNGDANSQTQSSKIYNT